MPDCGLHTWRSYLLFSIDEVISTKLYQRCASVFFGIAIWKTITVILTAHQPKRIIHLAYLLTKRRADVLERLGRRGAAASGCDTLVVLAQQL
jgi:hypothetical protein